MDKVSSGQRSFEEMVREKIRALLDRLDGYPIKNLYDEMIGHVERPLIELVLERTAGNQIKAAAMLGLNRNTLRKKMLEHGLGENKPRRVAAQKPTKSTAKSAKR